jgi:nucleoside-diphosphate-sugar epimerase
MRDQPGSRPSLQPLQRSPLRLLVTGGTGVLGRALRPLAEAAGHELAMPGRQELDLFDPSAVAGAVRDVDGVLHLATRIRSIEQISDPDAWRENDRLRADASRILVDAAIEAGATVYVQPTVTFVYPPNGPVSEDTPFREVQPILRSALAAEQQTERFARRRTRRRPAIWAARRPGHRQRPAEGRLRRHAARLRCRARAPLGALASQRHLQRLP